MSIPLPPDIVAQYNLTPEDLANIPPPGASLQTLQNWNLGVGNPTFVPPLPGPTPVTYSNQPQQNPSVSAGTLPFTNSALPLPAQSPLVTGGNPLVAQHEAKQNLLGAQQEAAFRDRAVVQAFPAVKEAKTAEFAAREADVAANRKYLDIQTQANAERQAEFEKIKAARENTPNLIAAARGQRERDAYAYHYQLAGLPTPVEVKLPPGFKGPLPPGLVEKIQTFAEQFEDAAANAEQMRKFEIEAARIHSANTGLDVSVAAIRSGKVALTLDELEMAARAAGIDVNLANVALGAASLPPEAGMVWDEITNQWTTPLQAQLNQSEALQEAQREQLRQKYGDYADVPNESLISSAYLFDTPIMSDDELQQVLLRRGMSQTTVNFWMSYINAQRAKKDKDSSSSLIVSAMSRQINAYRQQGVNDAEIRRRLQLAGATEEEINAAFAKAAAAPSGTTTATPQPPVPFGAGPGLPSNPFG